MTGTALPWRAYPEPFRETYELCDGNGVTIARNMQRCVAEAVAPSSTSASGCAAASK